MCKLQVGDPCENFDCHHNIFWKRLNFDKGEDETGKAWAIQNCLVNLSTELADNDGYMTVDELSRLYGLSRQGIYDLMERGLDQLREIIESSDLINLREGDENKTDCLMEQIEKSL